MDEEQWHRAQLIFHEVVDQDPSLQSSLISSLSRGDIIVHQLVDSMIGEDVSAARLIDTELPGVASHLLLREREDLARQKFGPYRLVRLLGEGGMGVVYLAERDDLGSQAAIKILRDSSLSPMRRLRFAAEQQLHSQLNHPCIARLYDVDALEDGTPYIVMEYCDGVPLAKYVADHVTSVSGILELLLSVCAAVQYAHAKAIIHRDLKPSNILVTRDGLVKLLDFGISKQLKPDGITKERTSTALRMMTVAYAAPEALRGEQDSIQVDVYSLGILLYELLSGRLPFDFSQKTTGQIEQLIAQGASAPSILGRRWARPPASEHGWSELDTICLTAMHNDPARRYASVEALVRDIVHYMKREPLEARPDSWAYRGQKFLVRNGKALAWAAAFCIAVIAVAALSLLRIEKARRETAVQQARSAKIQSFMLNLFNGGDTHSGPSEDLRVTTLVDRGVQQAKQLDQDPETGAQLDQTLAGIYDKLGKLDKADPLLEAALDIRGKLYGQDSPQVAETLTELGVLRLEQATPKQGEALIRRALSIEQRVLPAGDPAIAKSMSALGQVLEESGAYHEAVSMLQGAIKLQNGRPELASDLSTSLSHLATVDFYLGRYAEAESLGRQALAGDQQVYGQLHPRVADDLVDLGEMAHALGRDKEAEDLDRKALAIKTAWYGEKHSDTAFCLLAVGQSLVYQKRFQEAAPFVQKSLMIQQENFGKFHPRIAMVLSVAGVLQERLGHYDAAEKDFLQMAAIHRATYGDRHSLVGVAMLNLGQVYLDRKQYAKAQTYLRGALERFQETLPPEHPYVAIAKLKLGMVSSSEHKYPDAEALLLSAYQTFSKQTPPAQDRMATTRNELVKVYKHLYAPDKAGVAIASLSIH